MGGRFKWETARRRDAEREVQRAKRKPPRLRTHKKRPTPRQLLFLQHLGVYEVPETMAAASELIRQAKEARDRALRT